MEAKIIENERKVLAQKATSKSDSVVEVWYERQDHIFELSPNLRYTDPEWLEC